MAVARGNNYLNGEQLYTVYCTQGSDRSCGKLVKWCLSKRILNPRTQKPPNRMGVWKAMYRWVVRNPDKAFEIAQQYYRDTGQFLTREEWNKDLKPKVKTSYQSESFTKRWTKQHAN